MKKFLLILTVVFLWTCSGGGGGSPTEPQEPTYIVNLTSLSGNAQKGPFNNGTAINIGELTSGLSPTGRNFSSAITDNTGRFSVANVQLESPYVELRANGYYFNEVSNQISSGQLTLFALSNLSGKTSLNVNIITHLEKNRMAVLMSGDNPKTFAEAKLQAQEEVFAIFDYSRANVPESELLDISQGGSANGKLLAMSAIIQGDLTVGQMSELLANMSTDIATDGTLDDANIQTTLIDNSKNLDMAQIRANLEARYTALGISATIPDFETEVNQFLKPPVAQDINASTPEDTAINITLAGSDPEGESLTYTILEENNGTVTLNGDGVTVNYVPNTNFNGTDSFKYYANDGITDSNIAIVTITVLAEDDEPNTNDVSVSTNEDVAVAMNLTADEYDGESYSFAIINQPSNGSVSLNGFTATYVPNQNWNGTDTFTFEATDDRIIFGQRNVATATIVVNPVNDNPTTNDVSTTTDETRTSMRMVPIDLDGNDIDGDDLTYSLVTAPSNGAASINGATLSYNPDKDWNGVETFTYKASDGIADSNTSTITITVNPVNDVPAVLGEDENTQSISLNGGYIDMGTTVGTFSAAMTIQAWAKTDVYQSNKYIVGKADNTNFNHRAYALKGPYDNPGHGSNGSENKWVSEMVVGNVEYYLNSSTDAQLGAWTHLVMTYDGSIIKLYVNGLLSDSEVAGGNIGGSNSPQQPFRVGSMKGGSQYDFYGDVDGVAIWTTALTESDISTLYNSGDGSSPAEIETSNLVGYWNFEGDFNDLALNHPGTPSGNVSFTTSIPGSFGSNGVAFKATDEDTPLNIDLPAKDVDGDDLTYSIVSDVSNGTTSLSGTTVTYTPNTNWSGTDTFTYKANDGTLDSNIGTIEITVNPTNDDPVTSNESASTNEDTAVDITLNANDPDATILNFFVVNGPSNGTVTIDNDFLPLAGIATYTPNANWNGTDTFTYKANDGTDDSNTATVTVTVAAVNDVPIATGNGLTINEDASGSTFTMSGTDVDGDDLIRILTVIPSNGDAYNDAGGGNPDGSALAVGDTLASVSTIYNPDANWNGTDIIEFKVNDGIADSSPLALNLVVNPVNDLPTATGIAINSNEDDVVTVDLSSYATDIDGDNLTYSVHSQPGDGTLSISGSTATYTPNANYNGSDTSNWIVSDGTANASIVGRVGALTITVAAVNDAPVSSAVSVSANEDIAKAITLSATDLEGSSLTYSIVSNPSNGSLGSVSGASVTYTPDADWYGTDTFTYKANDGTDDSNTSTVTVTVTSIPEHTIYSDLTSGYDEFFSDIVYDKSTGGYSVGGFTRHTGDSGSGGTWAMTYLATNADLSSTTRYETVSTTLTGMGASMDNDREGSVHFFDISERSTDGGFLVSNTNDYLNSVTSSATATYAQLSGSIASGYKWIDYIQASYQTSDGGYLIVGKVSTEDSDDQYPVIAKVDASLNIDYFKVLTNHATTASLKYRVNDIEFVKVDGNDEDDTYYLAAETSVSGLSGTNAIQYYKISDGGSSFTVDQYVNLSDIANSPTQIVSEGTSIDAMAYLGTGEFAIITNGGNGQQLTRYSVDSSGSATLESGSYDLSSYSNYMEILLSNNYIYIVVTSGDDIKVIQLSDTLSENWSRTLDITGLGYADKLGGATATGFGTDGNGIAITGSTKNDDDWDGFIVIVNDAGNRIY